MIFVPPITKKMPWRQLSVGTTGLFKNYRGGDTINSCCCLLGKHPPPALLAFRRSLARPPDSSARWGLLLWEWALMMVPSGLRWLSRWRAEGDVCPQISDSDRFIDVVDFDDHLADGNKSWRGSSASHFSGRLTWHSNKWQKLPSKMRKMVKKPGASPAFSRLNETLFAGDPQPQGIKWSCWLWHPAEADIQRLDIHAALRLGPPAPTWSMLVRQ